MIRSTASIQTIISTSSLPKTFNNIQKVQLYPKHYTGCTRNLTLLPFESTNQSNPIRNNRQTTHITPKQDTKSHLPESTQTRNLNNSKEVQLQPHMLRMRVHTPPQNDIAARSDLHIYFGEPATYTNRSLRFSKLVMSFPCVVASRSSLRVRTAKCAVLCAV